MTLSPHPDRALAAAASAAAALLAAHPPEFYAVAQAAWEAEHRAHALALREVDLHLQATALEGEDIGRPSVHVLLVLRQQEASALALAWLRYARAHGRTRRERSAGLEAMSSWVVYAARAGVRGCLLTGPVTVPLIQSSERRGRRGRAA